MKNELYIYELCKQDRGKKIYKVRRRAKEVVCWDCGYKWLIRKSRKSPMYCRSCACKNGQSNLKNWNNPKKGDKNFDQKEYTRNYNNQMRIDKKKQIVKHMGNQCTICKAKNLPLCVWQWHHTNSKDKEIAMSQLLTKSYEKILDESKKCILVCSNCHKVLHYGEEKLENREL